jgi:M6 family metalloprotease-like protein
MRTWKTRARGSFRVPNFVVPLAIAVAFLFSSSSSSFAQSGMTGSPSKGESALAAQVRALNNNVLQIHGRMQEASPGSADAIRSLAEPIIAQRAAALTTLIKTDPRTALSFAFSSELLANLAAKFPQSSGLLESQVTLRGSVEHWIMDSADMKTSHESWLINVGNTKLNLYFATGQRPDPKAGPVATIDGVQVGSNVAVSKVSSTPIGSASSVFAQIANFLTGQRSLALAVMLVGFLLAGSRKLAGRTVGPQKPVLLRQLAVCGIAFLVAIFNPVAASAQSACSTTGAQNVAVLLVTFPGITPPSTVTAQSVYNLFFGTTDPSLNGYWAQASYGKTSPAGNVFGWYTLSGAYSCSNINQFVDDAVAAAASAGVNFQTYNRVFVVFPDMSPSCGWAGLSSIGCYSASTTSGTYTISASVLVWNYLTTPDQGVSLIAHEGGHQLGLAHARLRTFTDSTGTAIPLGALGTTGTLYEYGDNFSTMGPENLGHYAAGHKSEILNWFASGTNFQVVQSSGTYTIQPYETNPAGLEALKIQRGTGNNAWLWVEYRQPLGNYDSTLPAQPFGGGLIHYEDSITGPQTDLLDFTAPSTYSYNPALAAGQTWTDPYSNVSISVLSATSNGLTVSVSYGAVPCTASAPSVSVSPLDPSIYPGQIAGYSVTVTDNDSSGCSSSTINLGSTEPSGWSTSLSTSSVTLSPGQSASITLGKGAPSGTPAGTYAVNLNASNNTTTGSATANATVMTPPSLAVSISVSGSSFTRPGTVPITASVTNGGTPASGASVTFTLTAPNGGTSTQTATTGTNGTATWNYKLNSKSLAGTYSVSAQAAPSSGSGGKKTSTSSSTQTATSNAASFSVQ